MFSIISGVINYTVFNKDMNRLTGTEAIRYDRDLQNQHVYHYTMDEMAAVGQKIDIIYNNPEYQNKKNSEFSPDSLNTTPLSDEAYWKYLREYKALSIARHRTTDVKWYIDDLQKNGDLTELYSGTISKFSSDDVLVPLADVDNPKVQKIIMMFSKIKLPIYSEYNQGWAHFHKMRCYFSMDCRAYYYRRYRSSFLRRKKRGY
jgi:hypothetical protein